MVNTLRSKNTCWEIGAKVNIGFMKNLTVVAVKAVRDFMPDIYTLVSEKGVQYEFIPHHGLSKI